MKYTILSLLSHLALMLAIVAKIEPSNKSQPQAVQIHAVYRPPNQPVKAPFKSLAAARRSSRPHATPSPSIPTQPAEGSALTKTSDNFADLVLTKPVRREQPELINNTDLSIAYPQKARLHRIEGTVRLKLTINQQGQVIDAQVLSGPAYGLREAALKLAAKLCFLPATNEHGQPKGAHIEHEVVFRLRFANSV